MSGARAAGLDRVPVPPLEVIIYLAQHLLKLEEVLVQGKGVAVVFLVSVLYLIPDHCYQPGSHPSANTDTMHTPLS